MSFLSILLILVFLNLSLGLFVLFQNIKSFDNRIFSALCFISILWNLSDFFSDAYVSIYWLSASYAFGALVISLGLIWIYKVTQTKITRREMAFILILGFIFFILSLIPGFVVTSLSQSYSSLVFNIKIGFGLYLYTIYYLIFSSIIIRKLFLSKKSSTSSNNKKLFTYIFIGVTTCLFVTGISSFILPFLSIHLVSLLDSLGFLCFLIFISFAISKHQLFKIKVIAIELVTFALWILVIIRIAEAKTPEEMINEITTLIITIIMGIFLIRGVFQEIRQAKKVEELTNSLKSAYKNIESLNEQIDTQQLINSRKN